MSTTHDVTTGLPALGRHSDLPAAGTINWMLLTGLIAAGAVSLVVATTVSQALDSPGLPVSALVQPAASLAPQPLASSVVWDADALPEALPPTF